jgi:Family of unknown function (DUF6159)
MGRFRRSLTLFGMSFGLLRQHRGLLAFPLVSLAASLVVAASFVLPVFAFLSRSGTPSPAGYLILACGYAVLACVTVFCNAALIHAASLAMDGGSPTFRASFAAAAARKGAILRWGLVSGTVSLALRAAEQRLGPLGRFMDMLGGLAWTMVTYLVLPLIVLEDITVRRAVSRSSELFKRTWGTRLGAIIGVGWGIALLALPSLVVFALIASLGGSAWLITGLVLLGAWLLSVAVLGGALTGIFQTALYRFAAEGVPPAAFASAGLAAAVRPKRRWRN